MKLINCVFACFILVLSLVSIVDAPKLQESLSFYQNLPINFFEYWGYQKLAEQIGWSKVQEIANLIEESTYPEMVKSIISVESNWDVFALSPMDACGLMQVRMIAAKEIIPEVEFDDLFEPILNVQIGIAIFEKHMEYFSGFDEFEHWALTSYNRGRRGAFWLNRIPPCTEYSQKVLELMAVDSSSISSTG